MIIVVDLYLDTISWLDCAGPHGSSVGMQTDFLLHSVPPLFGCEIAARETSELDFAIMGTGQSLLDQMGKPHTCTCTLPGELAELG